MTETEAKRILEALLLVSEKPLLPAQAQEALGPEMQPGQIRRLLEGLAQGYVQSGSGLRIVEVAEGFQLVTDPALASYVGRFTRRVRAMRLTRPSLETLAIIAYRQPVTRVEMEQVRGVDVDGVLETLLRLSLIRILGRKETVGRPLLYGTTREFLDHFGLRSLEDLPSLEELQGVPPELKEMAGISATESGVEIAQSAEAPGAASTKLLSGEVPPEGGASAGRSHTAEAEPAAAQAPASAGAGTEGEGRLR